MKRTFAAIPILLLAACAQVRELQGGEKDTEAPVLLTAEPANRTTHFASDRIVLRFSERVKLDRVRDRLLISPPLEKAPDVTVNSGEEVVIALRAPLAPNTTYTFNIGEAVSDITEGNAAAGLTYVISTGAVLDSLALRGTVIDAFTDKPEPDVLVILHSDTDSTGFTTGRPAYFTRTDKQGGFVLSNLRGGRYRSHALQDKNANYRGDLPNERVGFTDTLVDTRDSVAIVLRMFLPLAGKQQVKEAAVQPDRAWRLVMARPADRLKLTSVDRTGGRLEWLEEWNPSRDTVLFWPNDTTMLDGQRFTASDTSGVIDTLTYRPTRKMPFNTDVKYTGIVGERTAFLASRPVRSIDQRKVRLRVDSNTIKTDQLAQLLEYDTLVNSRRLMLTVDPANDRNIVLELLPGAVRDIYGGENDTLSLSLGSATAAQAGDLKVNVVPDSTAAIAGPFLLQLINGQGGVVRSETFPALPHKADFTSTRAGAYTLKLTVDTDSDGRWSTGSLAERRQPEQVFRQQGEVTVRAGWEVVIDWQVVDR